MQSKEKEEKLLIEIKESRAKKLAKENADFLLTQIQLKDKYNESEMTPYERAVNLKGFNRL